MVFAKAINTRIIEEGFESLRQSAFAPGTPEIQVQEMRRAFYAGAAHLLGSVMRVLDPGSEPTERDLFQMQAIQNELDHFMSEVRAGRA